MTANFQIFITAIAVLGIAYLCFAFAYGIMGLIRRRDKLYELRIQQYLEQRMRVERDIKEAKHK